MDLEYLKNKKILLVDDEPELLSMVEGILEKEGYQNIRRAASVKETLEVFQEWTPEMAVLDVMLPDGDGFELFEKIREQSDIIVKPFLPKELTLRIGVILRRCYKEEQPVARLAACSIDFERAQVIKEGERLPLTAKEFALLSALYRNGGKIVTIDMLCQAVWGDNPYGYENSLMAHIRRIREKIEENPSKPVSLITVKGLGYKLMVKE